VTGEGVGIIEAPRGTLIHHYTTDQNGIVTDANIVVATTHNKGPINLAVRKAAKHFIRNGKVDEGILNHIEMAYRPYDLCLGCATHAVRPGSSPVEIKIYNDRKELTQTLKNF
jgi:F420-non-reducing hydrogenase large subunit